MTSPEVMDRPTAVYRFFDADVRLLYVGITCNLPARLRDHEAAAHWWPDQRSVTVAWKDSRAEALEEESAAILTELPRYNVVGAPPARAEVRRAERVDRVTATGLLAARKAIAAEVRAELARQGKTQREVGEVLNLPQPSITKRLAGETSFRSHELVLLAAYLGVPAGTFMPKPPTPLGEGRTSGLVGAAPVAHDGSGGVPPHPDADADFRLPRDIRGLA